MLNNHTESSHKPTARWETIVNLLYLLRQEMASADFCELRSAAMGTWRNITQVQAS